MRKEVQVVGIGKRRAGVSKKGKSYDFVPVSMIYADEGTEGHVALTLNVTGDDYVRNNIVVGDVLDVVMHMENFQMRLDAIL